MEHRKISRREFLRWSALSAATATLVACGGETEPTPEAEPSPAPETDASPPADVASQTTPTPVETPSTFSEAPMLSERVEAGDLPPIAERLPSVPLVIAHQWLQIGNYGGTLQLSSNNTGGMADYVHMMMYGHSLLRYLKDGLEVGPGLVESWESNDDASEWTLHFREGLKWSDGEPFTTADITYWWEDLVLNEDHPEGIPDEARSGVGTIMTLEQVDDYTLRFVFDAPAPLIADRLAMHPNAGIGTRWVAPRHYLEQFHPKYNDQLSDYAEHDEKMDFRTNPECPTMTGWMLTQYEEGVRGVWERNPYYWCVDQEGNQLPYIDRINMAGVQDIEVQKLGFLEGQVDYAHFHSLTLADVSAFRDAQARSGLEVRLLDSGSGTGSMFFFNYDYRDDQMRELIRNPQFRKALSHAYDRQEVQRVVYFETGELTTGTYSPKAVEYLFNEEAQQRYAEWRDSALAFDRDRAQAMLDEIGVVDANDDGVRELPDGSPLLVRLDMPADVGEEHLRKNELLGQDWQAVGINTQLNPVPPAGLQEQWQAGELMSQTAWEVGNGPDHLTNATWLVPLEPSRWAPLHGNFYAVRGTAQEGTEADVEPWDRAPPRMAAEEGGPIDRLWQLYDRARVEPDALQRHRLVWDMIKIHVEDGPFFMGCVANYPRIVLVRQELLNVPQREDLALGGFLNPWSVPAPAMYDPESWYWENPEAHT